MHQQWPSPASHATAATESHMTDASEMVITNHTNNQIL